MHNNNKKTRRHRWLVALLLTSACCLLLVIIATLSLPTEVLNDATSAHSSEPKNNNRRRRSIQVEESAVHLDGVDVADAAIVSASCTLVRRADDDEDIMQWGECLDLCRQTSPCVASTFYASPESMLRQREDNTEDGKTVASSSAIPIFKLAEQLHHRSGRCTQLQCHVDPQAEEVHRMVTSMIVQRSKRRAQVQPVSSWFADDAMLRLFLSPPPQFSQVAMAAERTLHFLMLSSLRHLNTRLLPALSTWARGQRVSVFLDGEGSGLDAHQESHQGGESISKEDALALLKKSAQRLGSIVSIFNISKSTAAPLKSDDHLWLRRRSINGAWKPLVILAALNKYRSRMNALHLDEWFVLVDDDTFMHVGNLNLHLDHLMHIEGDGLCNTMTASGTRRCSFAMGEPNRFTMLMSQRNYVGDGGGRNISTFLPPSMTPLDYLQGGAGIVLTSAFVENILSCLEGLHIMMSSSALGDDDERQPSWERDVFEVSNVGSFGDQRAKDVPIIIEGKKVLLVHIAKGFADHWPAGDMRVAWAARECQRLEPRKPGAPVRRPLFEQQAAFSHRSLELSLGADRRHWMSSFPVSFHRCRGAADFDRLHHVMRGDTSSSLSWKVVESRAAEWWETVAVAMSQRGRGAEAADEVRKAFFIDDGFA